MVGELGGGGGGGLFICYYDVKIASFITFLVLLSKLRRSLDSNLIRSLGQDSFSTLPRLFDL